MKARVFVLEGGRIQVFVDEGTFKEATELTKRIIETFKAQGLPLELQGEIEMHRSGVEHAHVQGEVHHEL
jgi:hypothetical protein